jgi:hypothetical protein
MKSYLTGRDDFKYAGGVGTTSEALELVKDKLPHVILTDIKLRNGHDGSDFIEAVEEMNHELKIKPLIFVMSQNGFYEGLSVKKGLPFIEKSNITTPEVIMKRVARNFTPDFPVANRRESEPQPPRDVRDRAMDQMDSRLDGLGISKYKGSTYIAYIVVYLAEIKGENPNLDTVYGIAAKRYNVTKSSVESAIRKAIQSIWDIADTDTKKQYYGGFACSDKGAPTSLTFISHYVKEIKRGYYSENR